MFVERFIAELNLVPSVPKEKNRLPQQAPHWIRPPEGLIKVNVDAAISKNQAQASVAAVARDEDG
jgi:hypothetical protein